MKKRTTGKSQQSSMSGAEWSCHPLKRVNYFSGQLLSANDFQAEQDYLMDKHRRHNRLCHGFGVVQGLEVTVTSDNGASALIVSPGFAIDPIGNEIQLCAPIRLGVGTVETPIYVLIRFKECPTDPVPAAGGPTMTPLDALRYSRIEEGADLYLSVDAVPPTLALARLIRSGKAWHLDRKFKPKRLR